MKVLDTRPIAELVTFAVKRVETLARGPWPTDCVRAARLRRAVLGIPLGSARTVGARFMDFLTTWWVAMVC